MNADDVQAMLKKSALSSDTFFRDRNAVQGIRDRKDAERQKRKEEKNTLSQWYGMKRRELTVDQKKELELLQYRGFLDPTTKHIAPKRTKDEPSEFVEFGYFSDVGRSKRKRLASFADEWVEDNPEFMTVIQKRMKTNIKLQKKSRQHAAKVAARKALREQKKSGSKRKRKDIF